MCDVLPVQYAGYLRTATELRHEDKRDFLKHRFAAFPISDSNKLCIIAHSTT